MIFIFKTNKRKHLRLDTECATATLQDSNKISSIDILDISATSCRLSKDINLDNFMLTLNIEGLSFPVTVSKHSKNIFLFNYNKKLEKYILSNKFKDNEDLLPKTKSL